MPDAPAAPSDPPPARPEPGALALGVALVALAGYVDAVSFLAFGGVFASFMSGDTTQLGAALGRGEPAQAILFLSTAALFVTGVMAGRMLWWRSARWGRSAVLLLVALLLAAAATTAGTGWSASALVLAVLAMGRAERGDPPGGGRARQLHLRHRRAGARGRGAGRPADRARGAATCGPSSCSGWDWPRERCWAPTPTPPGVREC